MANDDVERARRRFAAFIDQHASRALRGLNVDPDSRADEVRDRLSALFRDDPALTAVMIRLGEEEVGVGTPAAVRRAAGTAGGGTGEIGVGDGASLPGRSTRYRVIRFACAHCGATEARSFYDERDIPRCPESPSVLMELQP